ncbi:MAG: DUF4845 domain-containing protein [Burkholderiales bacterium]|jgi:hypothetical protein|nr:DUF4845 domain-containing protein [Burkholderiales bacterium]
MNRQKGLGFLGILIVLVLIVLGAIMGMKVVPAVIEFYTIKKAVTGITQSGELRNATVADVRKAFDRRADVDDFKSVSGKDLEITKEGNEIVVSFAYERRVHLFGPVSLLFDFQGSSAPSTIKPRGE